MREKFEDYKNTLPDWVKSEEDFERYRLLHSAEHVFAHAITQLYPERIRLAVAHIDRNTFANDASWEVKLTEEDFGKIEAKMQELIDRDLPIVRKEVSADEAKKLFKGNPFKLEWINQFSSDGETITVYQTGDEYVDFCKGPHVESTGEVKAFKLLSIAGAYWRGDENAEMLTRVYGTAFPSKKELEDHLKELEVARERDHRKINEYMDIFTTSELVGRGLIMYTPRGTTVKNTLKDHLLDICKKYGAMEVDIPHMAKIDLYQISGHAEKFKDELFRVTGHYGNEYVLKPVNCPHHTQIYASRPRSYRDLPLAYVESTQQHRDEKPGAMSGLNRAVSFEIDDGHTFCRPDQIKEEAIKIVNIIREFYSSLGMWGEHWVSLSFKDARTPEKYIGDEADWQLAQSMLKEINEELELGGRIMEGDAALYGPKLDFMLKDALGNERQLGTVQIDFAMPKRFGLTYTDKDGSEKTPVMLHRAILGSYHRFISYLMESTNGAFPTWLAPEQVRIIPISTDNVDYAKKIGSELADSGVRVFVDEENERMQNKIRKAQEVKVPYMVIIGKQEASEGTVSVRLRSGEEVKGLKFEDFADKLKGNIAMRKVELALD